MNTTASNLIRWAGIPAAVAGVLYLFIQPIHPPHDLASVTTATWAVVHALTVTMCILGMLGLTGLYARQARRAGWLGVAGYLLFGLFFALTLPMAFAEAFILPLVAGDAPGFVSATLAVFGGEPAGGANLGALSVIAQLNAAPYVLGGLLFGIATFRAGVLPRWAGALLAFGAVAPLAFALLPHEYVRIAAVPVGAALTWLGFALVTEPHDAALEVPAGRGGARLRQARVE